jgi:hypothetical protein
VSLFSALFAEPFLTVGCLSSLSRLVLSAVVRRAPTRRSVLHMGASGYVASCSVPDDPAFFYGLPLSRSAPFGYSYVPVVPLGALALPVGAGNSAIDAVTMLSASAFNASS